MADQIFRKAPLILGSIVLLLVVNILLQYTAGPTLHQALPQDARSAVQLDGDRQNLQHGPNHDLMTDVAPGGADAELLCIDKQVTCDPQQCNKVSIKYQDCKSTCNTCDHLRKSIQTDTGLQVRVVQQLSPCLDLHPSCDSWVQEDKCAQEPKSMLELCQASCKFCLPLVISSLASDGSSSTKTSGKQLGSGDADSVLLDACQDDMNVCPYLAASGMCSSGSLWIITQCPRSCRKCTPTGTPGVVQVAVHHPGLTQQLVDSSLSTDSLVATIGIVKEAKSAPQAAELDSHRESNFSLYGSPSADRTTFTAQKLQEWPVQNCHDYVDRCPAWAADGECSRNIDYMMISCKQSCQNCKQYVTSTPFQVVQLNSGYAMPTVGFGTAGLGVSTAAAVQYALTVGYRMIDTAESPDWYSEDQVGVGIAAAKVPREELFITSKVHPRDFGRNGTLAALKRSLKKLNTGYLDLILLHYPSCSPGTNCVAQPYLRWQDSWRALEELVAAKLVHSIGVSNFGLSELQELLQLAKIQPAVLQTRSDPFAVNHHLINFCIEHNITFVGYSSLGTQWINSPAAVNPVMTSEMIKQVAENHAGKTAAQVVLRWALQRGQVVIPRSRSTEHIEANLQLFDFELSNLEMQVMNSLDGTWKTGGLPLPVA